MGALRKDCLGRAFHDDPALPVSLIHDGHALARGIEGKFVAQDILSTQRIHVHTRCSGCSQQCDLQGVAYRRFLTRDRAVAQRPQFQERALKLCGRELVDLHAVFGQCPRFVGRDRGHGTEGFHRLQSLHNGMLACKTVGSQG